MEHLRKDHGSKVTLLDKFSVKAWLPLPRSSEIACFEGSYRVVLDRCLCAISAPPHRHCRPCCQEAFTNKQKPSDIGGGRFVIGNALEPSSLVVAMAMKAQKRPCVPLRLLCVLDPVLALPLDGRTGRCY